MTTEEFHALDLDCAKLMNFKSVKSIEQTNHDRPTMRRVVVREHDHVVRYFEPTTSRADAMEVLEWLIKTNAGRSIGVVNVSSIMLGWINGKDGGFTPCVFGETLPLAICKFALEVGRGRG